MSDFFEIDFLDIKSSKSGDAIAIRYQIDDVSRIHVTDGGFQDTGDSVVTHINKYYGAPTYIDSVIVSHPDGDHTGGLKKVLEEYEVGELWMLRPWLYADELIVRFSRFTSVANLSARLKEIYPNIAALEKLANERGVPIREPFQGATIGHFKVMAPTKARYLDLVVESEKTPQVTTEAQLSTASSTGRFLEKVARKVITLIRAAWGEEMFAEEETSPENNMSVVQYASLFGVKVLLTADAGRDALTEAADYAPFVGLTLPGVDRIQVPHHGSRHNVSTELLDRWLGPRLISQPKNGEGTITAIVSAAKKDDDHPRKAVIRAFIHRGAKVFTTEGASLRTGYNAPTREGWSSAEAVTYPEDQESEGDFSAEHAQM
jgi:hypothetical protein